MLDYRGYGKSQGRIGSEAHLLADADAAYQQLHTEYAEARTVLLGYSLGTGVAAWLAAHHHPRLLILQAPYYSLRDVAHTHYPWRGCPAGCCATPCPRTRYCRASKRRSCFFMAPKTKQFLTAQRKNCKPYSSPRTGSSRWKARDTTA